MDSVPKLLGKAHLQPVQENFRGDAEPVRRQEGLIHRHPLPPLPLNFPSPSTMHGMNQKGSEHPTTSRQMPHQGTSPKTAHRPHPDGGKFVEEVDSDREGPRLARVQSFSRPSTAGANSVFDTTPLPPPPPTLPPTPHGFTINVQPGPTGTSISVSGGSQNGQRDGNLQSPAEQNGFGSSTTWTPRHIGESNSPGSHSFQFPHSSNTSTQNLKNPSASVRELGFTRPQHARTMTSSTAASQVHAGYGNGDRNNETMSSRYEEEGKGFGITTYESKDVRQEYLLKLARALIFFGAPPHRLEECLTESSIALGIKGQFMYSYGLMVCSFDEIIDGDDDTPHTGSRAEVKIVKEKEGVDMDKLDDLRHIFKEVKAGEMSCAEGTDKINKLISRDPQNDTIVMLFAYGFASVFVGTFAFESRPIDLPVQFFLGILTGTLHVIVTRYVPFSIVFEVLCPLITSFLARALGSINGGNTFCFSALAQAAIVLILPGYVMMMAMLELQSKKVASGVIRAVQALLYTMFLALGMAVGSAIYGAMDSHATSATRCHGAAQLPTYYRFIGATCFSLALSVTMQIKWKQCPIAVVIALLGFVVNYLGSLAFPQTPQIFNVIASFFIGVCGNLYARLGHGLAVGIIMPALTIQVPSALAASAALLSGLSDANAIHNTTVFNGVGVQVNNGTSQVDPVYHASIDQVVYTVGISIAELGLAIAIGLALANMAVYPLGLKKRGGLFGH